jgi:hypothetical protein
MGDRGEEIGTRNRLRSSMTACKFHNSVKLSSETREWAEVASTEVASPALVPSVRDLLHHSMVILPHARTVAPQRCAVADWGALPSDTALQGQCAAWKPGGTGGRENSRSGCDPPPKVGVSERIRRLAQVTHPSSVNYQLHQAYKSPK